MKKVSLLIAVIVAGFLQHSCKSDGTALMKPVTGKPGETLIVISEDLWKGMAGDTIFHFMTQPQLGLPQAEPVLDLVNIPPDAFGDIFKSNRNIILTKVSSSVKEPKVTYRKNVWAQPQVVISIVAPDEESFTNTFVENSDRIIGSFISAEKKRLMNAYKQEKFRSKEIFNTMKKNHDFTLNVPKGFRIAQDTTDFVWLLYRTPAMDQGIFAYWYPYESDSTFTVDYLLRKRDSVLKENVPGPTRGSYMTTEHRVDPLFNAFKLNGNYTVEMRGLWRVENDFMGGPYVSLSTLDPIRKRIVTVEGYVYAPKYDKREYLRQMEAVIYSIVFPDQAKNDKINRMHELGEEADVETTAKAES